MEKLSEPQTTLSEWEIAMQGVEFMGDATELHPDVQSFIEERQENTEHFTVKDIESIVFPELQDILRQETEIAGNWNPVEIYTAINVKEEKARFLKEFKSGKTPENPEFQYDLSNANEYLVGRKELSKLHRRSLDLAKKYRKSPERTDQLKYYGAMLAVLKIHDDTATCGMVEGIKNHDDAKTKLALERKYGRLSNQVVQAAEQVYQEMLHPETEVSGAESPALLTPEQQEWLKNKEYNATEVAEVMAWALNEYGLLATKPGDPGYLVSVEDQATAIDVRDKSQSGQPIIAIPRAIDQNPKNGRNVMSLIGHEVGAHVRQSMNGAKLFEFGGANLKIDGEALYEGLAKQADQRFAEEFFGEKSAKPLPFFVKAIKMAEDGATFSQVFAENHRLRMAIKPDQDPYGQKLLNSCWSTTYRVFRGSTDPENKSHYAMPKDKAYLEGWVMAEELEEIGYGDYNQVTITTGAGLRLLGKIDIKESDLPYPWQDLQKKYWEEILKPQYEAEQAGKSSFSTQAMI